MWEQYNQYKSIHKQLAKVKPEKREQFEPVSYTHLDVYKRQRLDMDSYMRIVNNLIQNVIAHSHADKIKIALSKKENNMEMLLADNGVGIEKEDLKDVYKRQ